MAQEIALTKEEDRFILDSPRELLQKRLEKNKKLLEENNLRKLRTEYENIRYTLAGDFGFNKEEIGLFSKEELQALDEFLVFKTKKYRRIFFVVVNCVVPFLSVTAALIVHPIFIAFLWFLILDILPFVDRYTFRFLVLRKKLQKLDELDEKGG